LLGLEGGLGWMDSEPHVTANGLTLLLDDGAFFDDSFAHRPGGFGQADIWIASRETNDDDFGAPVNMGDTVNSRWNDVNPAISPNGLRLFFSSNRSGNYDIWMSTRNTPSDPWNEPVQLDENVNHPDYMEVAPSLSLDGSALYLLYL